MKLFHNFRCLFLSMAVMAAGAQAFAQNVTVKGKVSDSSGEPVIGVTVMLSSNNTVGTLTDAGGNYTITVPANSSLTFSCVGFATQEEQLNGRTVINVVLQEDTEFLDETVVIGYGTQKKRLLTGATINITGDEIQKQSTTNALGALYSSVP
ncbi:MAG: carboxypeptidase-like regulatory domain-containing protein, partial [Bacteroidales bacterium]|nr:carboxypeptidase-like regulatory domain-containing protein [Bacteroidales bacterium]